jgi:hypothetical protein
MKRMAHAVKVRRLVDQVLGTDPDARIVVGHFNATPDEVPVPAIRSNVADIGSPIRPQQAPVALASRPVLVMLGSLSGRQR